MNLKEKILADLKEAMKSKDQERLNTIRFLQSEIKYREIELRPAAITDAEVINVIKKLVKQRKESIEQFAQASRDDLVAKEKYELSVLETYLPTQMSKEQIAALVDEVAKSLNATSIKQMGAVIKEVQARTQGAADNKLISEVVKAKLAAN